MTTTAQDISMRRGDDKTIRIDIKDSAGAAKAIAGATSLKFRVYDSGELIITKDDGTIVADADSNADSAVQVLLVPADTSSILPAAYNWELEITESNGDVSTASVGKFTIVEDLVVT